MRYHTEVKAFWLKDHVILKNITKLLPNWELILFLAALPTFRNFEMYPARFFAYHGKESQTVAERAHSHDVWQEPAQYCKAIPYLSIKKVTIKVSLQPSF